MSRFAVVLSYNVGHNRTEFDHEVTSKSKAHAVWDAIRSLAQDELELGSKQIIDSIVVESVEEVQG